MPSVAMEWEGRLGRRLRVRDLYILATVVRTGGMAKAARQLAMTQPAVSTAIANLEHLLGVRLLDRSPQGVEPTIYADALLRRSSSVFDDLRQSVRDIEFLTNPTAGQLSVGSSESISATVLPLIVERFSKKYPRITLHLEDVPSPAIKSPALQERRYELILARWHPVDAPVDHLKAEPLFEDPFMVAAGVNTPWVRRRKVDLAELADQSWILPSPRTWNYEWIAREFRARGLGEPKVAITTFMGQLNAHFVRKGPFLTVHPRSWALHNGLAIVPVNVPLVPIPVSVVTLKNRTLSPVAERFVECAREVARTFPTSNKLTKRGVVAQQRASMA